MLEQINFTQMWLTLMFLLGAVFLVLLLVHYRVPLDPLFWSIFLIVFLLLAGLFAWLEAEAESQSPSRSTLSPMTMRNSE